MKTVALISGGKDSCFNMMCCIAEGHDVVALANLKPEKKDELDSYMYQTVGHHAIALYAEAMDLPLYTRTIQGSSLSTGQDYQAQEGDEVEDLYMLLARIKEEMNIEAVSVGAILSNYQRVRVENVCQRLNLVVLAFLWRRNQAELLKEMIDCGIRAIIIKVAALGLDVNKHLGLQLAEIYPHMLKMRAQYGLNECGEGGEYETFVFDCPLFKKAIVIDEVEKVIHSDDAFAPVGYLNLKKCHLHTKKWDSSSTLYDQISQLPMTTSKKLYKADADNQNTVCCREVPQYSLSPQTEDTSPSFKSDGKMFQVAGIRPIVASGEDITSLATRALNTLIECVEGSMNHRREDIVSVSLYVQNMSDFAAINYVYKTYFSMNPPVRLCVQTCLPPNVPLQLDSQGRVTTGQDPERRTMHVQSLSQWAPANIGPYSQAVWCGPTMYLAGMIPLVPATQRLLEAGLTAQCRTALDHVVKVLAAMCPGCDLSHCPLVTCYLTSASHVDTARAVLADSRAEVTTPALPLTVQWCVVPSLPRASLVEWQVLAWPQIHDVEENVKVIETKQHHEEYSLSLSCVQCNKTDLYSCRITLDMKLSRDGPPPSTEDVVEHLMSLYKHHCCRQSDLSMPGLVKVFFVHTAFQYTHLQHCFQKMSSCLDKLSCISLVPVLELDTPQQLLAWCQ